MITPWATFLSAVSGAKALMAHVSPAYVQRQLGHSSIAITVDRYCHWFPGEGRGDLEGALRGRVRKSNGKSHIIAYDKKKGL